MIFLLMYDVRVSHHIPCIINLPMQPFKAMEWLTVAPHPRPMTITKVERSIMMYDIPPL